eukprot:TRINITY_DN1718_c0_g1_i1.p1 TRINITY_DN1718_c0_g1~~TRINITY_DN1718_c0_g1_i1.p1  ORF type:complete len:156 (-),score=18.87 TRINITY_DN1718_c0_g1_i1:153-620(-)
MSTERGVLGKDPVYAQTMLRIKDPKPTLDFYTRLMGMKLLTKMDFPELKFSLYFLAFTDESPPYDPNTEGNKNADWLFQRKYMTLELTHNWGTETSDEKYHNGNTEPRGYGHIGFTLDDIYTTCEKLEKEGVKIVRKPSPFQNSLGVMFLNVFSI